MKNFVIYHSVSKRGPVIQRDSNEVFAILTDRPVKQAIGSRVWLISGTGKPARYHVHYAFTAMDSESGEDAGYKHRLWGLSGTLFTPPARIDQEIWFSDFAASQGNFAFGLSQITDAKAIEGLESLFALHPTEDVELELASEVDDEELEILDSEEFESELTESISEAWRTPPDELAERLARAPHFPERIGVVSMAFRRNPDVIVAVLRRANGVCENCGSKAPFLRRSDGSPYLEVHHIKRLADGGADRVDNATALCPNCHREAHYA